MKLLLSTLTLFICLFSNQYALAVGSDGCDPGKTLFGSGVYLRSTNAGYNFTTQAPSCFQKDPVCSICVLTPGHSPDQNKCPSNSTLGTNGCECDSGYTESDDGESCEAPDTPPEDDPDSNNDGSPPPEDDPPKDCDRDAAKLRFACPESGDCFPDTACLNGCGYERDYGSTDGIDCYSFPDSSNPTQAYCEDNYKGTGSSCSSSGSDLSSDSSDTPNANDPSEPPELDCASVGMVNNSTNTGCLSPPEDDCPSNYVKTSSGCEPMACPLCTFWSTAEEACIVNIACQQPSPDTDNDSIPDPVDDDIDGDGIPNTSDPAPTTPDGSGSGSGQSTNQTTGSPTGSGSVDGQDTGGSTSDCPPDQDCTSGSPNGDGNTNQSGSDCPDCAKENTQQQVLSEVKKLNEKLEDTVELETDIDAYGDFEQQDFMDMMIEKTPFYELTNFQPPAYYTECPTIDFDGVHFTVAGHTFSIDSLSVDSHCTLANNYRPIIHQVMNVVGTLAAIFILLG